MKFTLMRLISVVLAALCAAAHAEAPARAYVLAVSEVLRITSNVVNLHIEVIADVAPSAMTRGLLWAFGKVEK